MPDSATGEPRQLSNEAYTVGWICALDTEYIAAQLFLDEKHAPPVNTAKHDSNDYTLGRIGRHNIAIAVMPGGEYGVASAAVTATDMLSTFTNIRIGLMVGIGGGAPSAKNDIRLGDVVVSLPQNGLGGVFQYDFGKKIQDQPFQPTGFLAPPPRVVLTAIHGLKAEYAINGHTIQGDIIACLDERKRLRKRFGRPSPETDILYTSTTIHQAGENSCLGTCDADGASIISREAREDDEDDPAVHHGLIASANQLMKDAQLRDQYATRKNVLCFEMEAAGLMNHFPCIVIRGICDYSDTHKNKDWQGYAAMTAAAYAKDLLGRINPDRVEAEKKIKDVIDEVLSVTTAIKENVENFQADAHFAKITAWLSPPDPSTNLNEARKLHYSGTGQWLLESDRYQLWKMTPASFLWLYGIPGCGKTILSSTVITDLQQHNGASLTLLYFYFNFTDKSKRSTENAMLSLICQLYHQDIVARGVLDKIYAGANGRPGIEKLKTTLTDMLGVSKEAWIVLDGLDECESRGQHAADGVMPWIKSIRSAVNVHLLVTSRPEQDIKSAIESWADAEQIIPLQSNLVADDIGAYIDSKVNQMERWRDRPAIQQQMRTTLNSKADGMFRWVACQFDTLDNCLSPASVRDTLAKLPRTLDETYKQILRRLPLEYKPTARRLLQLLTYSKRPLSIKEAIDAISIEPASSCRFDPEYRMPIPEEITRYCSSLVSLVNRYDRFRETQIVELQLAHFSVQEYLQSDRLDAIEAEYLGQKEAAEAIANLCLSYLLAMKPSPVVKQVLKQVAEHGPLPAPSDRLGSETIGEMVKSWEQVTDDYPFANFSAQHWYTFAFLVESSDGKVLELVREYYNNHTAFTLGYLLHAPDEDGGYNFYKTASPLYYASCVGLKHSVHMLLKMNADVNADNGYYGTALLAASIKGHDAIVQMLIQHGADVNANGTGFVKCALAGALKHKHKAIAKILIQNGADVNKDFAELEDNSLRSESYWINALQAASYFGYQELVEILLQKGADINTEGGLYSTALLAASANSHFGIVQLLVQHGADINRFVDGYGDALVFAEESSLSTKNEHIEFLLQNGIRGYDEGLRIASCYGYQRTVEILLQKGADVNARDEDQAEGLDEGYHTALEWASFNGYKKIVVTLVQNGAYINSPDGDVFALYAAVEKNHHERPADNLEIVKFLIQNGADINAQGRYYGNALQAASQAGYQKLVTTLIQHDANINMQGGYYGSALQAAAQAGHREVVEILIQNGADVNVLGGYYGSALGAATEKGRQGIIETLFENGADMNAQYECKGSDLRAAVQRVATRLYRLTDVAAVRKDYRGIVELLIHNGADITMQGLISEHTLQAALAAKQQPIADIVLEQFLIRRQEQSLAEAQTKLLRLQQLQRWYQSPPYTKTPKEQA